MSAFALGGVVLIIERRSRDERVPYVTKETAICCQARVDAEGRPPIGYCSADCLRRPENMPDPPMRAHDVLDRGWHEGRMRRPSRAR